MELTITRRQCIATVIGFFLLTLGIYASSLGNDFVYYDDPYLILANGAIQSISPSTLFTIFSTYDPELYIPLTLLTYQFDWLLGGGAPFMFHLSNLLLHTANALLVSWFILLLSRRKGIALLCGLLFAVHPLHTEVVAWASARKDLLFSFFYLLSVVSYLAKSKRLSVVTFACALLSKVTAITLPFVLLLLDWRNGKTIDRKNLQEKLPYFGFAFLFSVIALFGKTETVGSTTLLQTMLMACKSTVFYLQKLVIPTELSVIYPYTEAISIQSMDFALPLMIVLLLLGLMVFYRKKDKEVTFGILFFFITLAPTYMSFVKGENFSEFFFASDRYAYLPSIGFFYVLILLIARLKIPALVQKGVVLVLIGILSMLASQQSAIWLHSGSLFQNVLIHYNNSHLAHNTLGAVYAEYGATDDALVRFRRSISIRPTPRAYYNIGLLEYKNGNDSFAIKANENAIALKPDYAAAYINLGVIHWENNERTKAIGYMRNAVEITPNDPDAVINLAAMLADFQQKEAAAILIEKILKTDPTNEHALAVAKKILGN